MSPRLIHLPVFADERGSLVALERFKGLEFDIRRVYYIFSTASGVTRGLHAHRRLRQLLVAVHGSCEVFLHDGREETSVSLSRPDRGLVVEAMTWRELRSFSDDAVLLVLADMVYDESDYIRDFDQFLREAALSENSP